MFWDDLIRRWRRDTGGMSPRLLRAAAGHVAVLPHRSHDGGCVSPGSS
jgi:hypothetical protein